MPKRRDPLEQLIFSQYLHSGLGLFFGLYSIYVAANDRSLTANPFAPFILMLGTGIIFGCSLVGFTSGYGLQKRKCWAWYTTLLSQLLYLLCGFCVFLSTFQTYATYSRSNTPLPSTGVELLPLIIQMILSFGIVQGLFTVLREYRHKRQSPRRIRYSAR